MDNLFNYVGVDLPQENPIVSDIVLKSLAREASESAQKNTGISSEIVFNELLPVLQKYFTPDNAKPITDQNIRQSSIVAISNYINMQDAFECRSMKEIYSLASGLYDSVINHITSIVKTTTLKEVECNVFPYTKHPWHASDNQIEKMQAAD